MRIDYKKELEAAAKSMILVHEPDVLIKMIVRNIVQKVKVRHSGILLHNKDKDTYVLTVSGGSSGTKIPAGFARMDSDNPLIKLFKEEKNSRILKDGALVYKAARKLLKRNHSRISKRLIEGALYQMEIFDAVACVPSYFRDDLLGILLLGRKNNGRQLAKGELNFFVALASDVAMAIRNAQLFTELELELSKNKKLFLHTTVALAAAIDAKDHYTHGHTARVTDLSLQIARSMHRNKPQVINEKFLEDLHIASLLHDIGKIGVPEPILNKEGPLNESERAKMQEHPVVGSAILSPIRELKEAIAGVKYHHERYDGSGYPEGLKGSEIPLVASIISVADSFDAMTTDRPYRKALAKEEAMKEVQLQKGRQFSPETVEALTELYEAKLI
ncbi:MAG: HD-GYP domain-containing protein [Candidatus Omnitrophota bacterium]